MTDPAPATAAWYRCPDHGWERHACCGRAALNVGGRYGEPPATAAPDCGDECRHVLLPRCPWCRTEMYAPAVWAFSHGTARCACGFKPDPKVKP